MAVTFETIASGYDEWYKAPLGALCDDLEKRAIFSLAGIERGELALDVGCGTGNYTLELARRGARAVGLDSSEAMITIASRKARARDLHVDFIRARAEALPLASETFDVVLSVTTLEFITSPDLAIGEMWRVLKPGGRLVIGVLNAWSIWAIGRARRKDSLYAQAHFFSAPELLRLLHPYGEVSWEGVIFFPPWPFIARGRFAKIIDDLASLVAKPLGAFLAARVVKRG
ncbi:MAG: class I SAM-dependent methyltransferase [Chloroflexi bacterium]|nr:class I SAM-dependent methyltransferase [Chloroflexota bacterium]MCL5076488.1 class I SAM-dependent methyltransferase [Chloroflexota bacterium]